jgi:hypothetical protein
VKAEKQRITKFTVRYDKRYRVEISLGRYQCLVSNATVEKQLCGLGFTDVNVMGSDRKRVAECSWLNDNATITITRIGTVDSSKSEYPLAQILQGLGDAKELQPPKETSSKQSKGNTKTRRKGRRS